MYTKRLPYLLALFIFLGTILASCNKEEDENVDIYLNPYEGLTFEQILEQYPTGNGLDSIENDLLKANEWKIGMIQSPGTNNIFEDRVGEISISVPSLGSPVGYQLITTIPSVGARFFYKEDINTIYWVDGGNVSLLSELLETGYGLTGQFAADPYLTSVNPDSIKVVESITENELIHGGITSSMEAQMLEVGWTKVSITYDGSAPFLFWDTENQISLGLYLAFLEPDLVIDGYEKGGIFVAQRCANLLSCWRWLV